MNAVQLLVIVLAHGSTLVVEPVSGSAESDADCNQKIFSCIQCSTETGDAGASLCRDPFDARLRKEFRRLYDTTPGNRASISRHNISTVLCDGFCIKWVKVPLSGQGRSVVRTCSTSMDIRFSQNTPVCIVESRTGKGTLCFCKDSMCNGAAEAAATFGCLQQLALPLLAIALARLTL